MIGLLANHPDRVFADHQAWQAHPDRLGISALSGTIDPNMVATEGALWGRIKAHGFLDSAVIMSKPAPAKARVTKRKISGGTRSNDGRAWRDAFFSRRSAFA